MPENPVLADPIYQECMRLARQSDCRKMHFGCVILNNGRVVGRGYNRRTEPVCQWYDCCEERKKIPSGTMLERCTAIHAEQMAVIQALSRFGEEVLGAAVLYVAGERGDGTPFFQTGFYCSFCSRILKEAGIRTIAEASDNGWVFETIDEALAASYEFARGEKKI